ncbi:LysR family transcriptional regulator, glycine cleavage system transcriptional activator [Thalassovita taeanensis]|uniref:LysR family transcriptional regulator, glycine cleavage system transcriptional activator n=2 Tax=Thalassovita taeanensis TaxID=657014 RepID=A0A1H9CQE4_9RHOB|nr:LysR family transcriptional regulator, glycine cleavage system transcriptional activator [Thalassovita taeanensis]
MSAAGTALNVSHAAISQQIKALEAHLGVTLLDRSTRLPGLTADGARLAEALEQGFDTVARAVAELTGADANRPLQLSVTPSFASGWLMPRLADFRHHHPQIDLMIDPTSEVKTLAPGGIDIALRYGNGQWPGLQAERLISSPIVIVAAPGVVDGEGPHAPEDLRNYHWLQELGTSEATDWLDLHGVTPDRAKGMTTLPGNLMIDAARNGQGIGVVARVFVAADIDAGRLIQLFQDDRRKGYYVVTRPGVQRPPLRAMVNWLRKQAAE